jgi:hypothetical protein
MFRLCLRILPWSNLSKEGLENSQENMFGISGFEAASMWKR